MFPSFTTGGVSNDGTGAAPNTGGIVFGGSGGVAGDASAPRDAGTADGTADVVDGPFHDASTHKDAAASG
jgi:hypothetical protein